jgi:hypothetical protein
MEDDMIKYSIFLAMLLGTSVAALAALAPDELPPPKPKNETVIYKNDVWPVIGPIVVEACGVEDCSDTPQSGT